MSTRIGLLGASGRMGLALVRRIAARDDLDLACALVRADSAAFGRDVGDLAGVGPLGLQTGATLTDCDAVIDFSNPEALQPRLDECAERGIALVSGTTALNYTQLQALSRASHKIPVFWSANMSVAVGLLHQLAATAAQVLGEDCDIEIVESHHRHKKDAPSGTALSLAQELARARGQQPDAVIKPGRAGADVPRQPGDIGISAVRAGEIVGDHRILFALNGETLELSHHAASRTAFADGALRAALWLKDRPAGQYGIKDLLGSSSSS